MSIPINKAIQLHNLSLKNSFIRSAIHSFLGTSDGFMTEAEYAMYEELCQNNFGLIISGHCCVKQGGRANVEQTCIYEDKYIEQFTKATQLAHKYNVAFMPQINHAGPRAVDTTDWRDVSNSKVKNHVATPLSLTEINDIRLAFIQAAQRLQKAGTDGVQIHAAHSYLLSRFIDPVFNQRTDEYGGSIENRFRLIAEIIAGIKEACGKSFPVAIKINSDTTGDDVAYAQDLPYIVEKCQNLGVEFIEWSGSDFIHMPRTASLYYLPRIAALATKYPTMPMSLVGGVKSTADIEKILSTDIKLISIARASICQPDILTQFANGKTDKTICVSCNRCFAIPHLHPGVRCIWAWKKIREQQRQKA